MKPLIGGHVSVAGGLVNGILNAERIGAEAIQIFGSSPRSWRVFFPSKESVALFKERKEKSLVKAVYLHAPYLVNLGSLIPSAFSQSVQNMIGHLEIAESIGAEGLIFHVGTTKGSDKEKSFTQATAGMKKILSAVPGKTKLIIENSAGGGEKIGRDSKEVAILFAGVKSQRLGVCIDTAHAFESGSIEKYEPKNLKVFLDEWDKAVGLKNVLALHANDSKTVFNSHHDRHENIGKGYIGLKGFQNLAKEKRLGHTAWLLEVPGFDNEGPDKKNVDILKACFR